MVLVAAWAAFRWVAIRAMASERGKPPVAPGLQVNERVSVGE